MGCFLYNDDSNQTYEPPSSPDGKHQVDKANASDSNGLQRELSDSVSVHPLNAIIKTEPSSIDDESNLLPERADSYTEAQRLRKLTSSDLQNLNCDFYQGSPSSVTEEISIIFHNKTSAVGDINASDPDSLRFDQMLEEGSSIPILNTFSRKLDRDQDHMVTSEKGSVTQQSGISRKRHSRKKRELSDNINAFPLHKIVKTETLDTERESSTKSSDSNLLSHGKKSGSLSMKFQKDIHGHFVLSDSSSNCEKLPVKSNRVSKTSAKTKKKLKTIKRAVRNSHGKELESSVKCVHTASDERSKPFSSSPRTNTDVTSKPGNSKIPESVSNTRETRSKTLGTRLNIKRIRERLHVSDGTDANIIVTSSNTPETRPKMLVASPNTTNTHSNTTRAGSYKSKNKIPISLNNLDSLLRYKTQPTTLINDNSITNTSENDSKAPSTDFNTLRADTVISRIGSITSGSSISSTKDDIPISIKNIVAVSRLGIHSPPITDLMINTPVTDSNTCNVLKEHLDSCTKPSNEDSALPLANDSVMSSDTGKKSTNLSIHSSKEYSLSSFKKKDGKAKDIDKTLTNGNLDRLENDGDLAVDERVVKATSPMKLGTRKHTSGGICTVIRKKASSVRSLLPPGDAQSQPFSSELNTPPRLEPYSLRSNDSLPQISEENDFVKSPPVLEKIYSDKSNTSFSCEQSVEQTNDEHSEIQRVSLSITYSQEIQHTEALTSSKGIVEIPCDEVFTPSQEIQCAKEITSSEINFYPKALRKCQQNLRIKPLTPSLENERNILNSDERANINNNQLPNYLVLNQDHSISNSDLSAKGETSKDSGKSLINEFGDKTSNHSSTSFADFLSKSSLEGSRFQDSNPCKLSSDLGKTITKSSTEGKSDDGQTQVKNESSSFVINNESTEKENKSNVSNKLQGSSDNIMSSDSSADSLVVLDTPHMLAVITSESDNQSRKDINDNENEAEKQSEILKKRKKAHYKDPSKIFCKEKEATNGIQATNSTTDDKVVILELEDKMISDRFRYVSALNVSNITEHQNTDETNDNIEVYDKVNPVSLTETTLGLSTLCSDQVFIPEYETNSEHMNDNVRRDMVSFSSPSSDSCATLLEQTLTNSVGTSYDFNNQSNPASNFFSKAASFFEFPFQTSNSNSITNKPQSGDLSSASNPSATSDAPSNASQINCQDPVHAGSVPSHLQFNTRNTSTQESIPVASETTVPRPLINYQSSYRNALKPNIGVNNVAQSNQNGRSGISRQSPKQPSDLSFPKNSRDPRIRRRYQSQQQMNSQHSNTNTSASVNQSAPVISRAPLTVKTAKVVPRVTPIPEDRNVLPEYNASNSTLMNKGKNATPTYNKTDATHTYNRANAMSTNNRVNTTPTHKAATPCNTTNAAAPCNTTNAATQCNTKTTYKPIDATPAYKPATPASKSPVTSYTTSDTSQVNYQDIAQAGSFPKISHNPENVTPTCIPANATPSYNSTIATPSYNSTNATPSRNPLNVTPVRKPANVTSAYNPTNTTLMYKSANPTSIYNTATTTTPVYYPQHAYRVPYENTRYNQTLLRQNVTRLSNQSYGIPGRSNYNISPPNRLNFSPIPSKTTNPNGCIDSDRGTHHRFLKASAYPYYMRPQVSTL